MSGVTQGIDEEGERSYLSEWLDPDGPSYLCPGRRPWLGEEHDEGCGRPLFGGLRSASNTYFADTVRSIYVPPRSTSRVDDELLSIIESPRIATIVEAVSSSGGEVSPGFLRQRFPGLFHRWEDAAVEEALHLSTEPADESDGDGGPQPHDEADFRSAEYDVLTRDVVSDQLVVRVREPDDYDAPVRPLFSRISLVEKLRVTTVFTGFNRVRADEGAARAKVDELWAEPPAHAERWLPASLVYGEGILLELDRSRVATWLGARSVTARAGAIDRAYDVSRRRGRPERDITPEMVAIHTLSHLLINQMAFASGYSAASLAERLYVTDDHAAVLIYTASGDSDGTLGGLVRLGRPGYLESLVAAALESGTWCSSDPICMELGESGGQGPDSCNLAACHSCCILPETACEEFNRFLDRGLVLGDHSGRLPGIASELV